MEAERCRYSWIFIGEGTGGKLLDLVIEFLYDPSEPMAEEQYKPHQEAGPKYWYRQGCQG